MKIKIEKILQEFLKIVDNAGNKCLPKFNVTKDIKKFRPNMEYAGETFAKAVCLLDCIASEVKLVGQIGYLC